MNTILLITLLLALIVGPAFAANETNVGPVSVDPATASGTTAAGEKLLNFDFRGVPIATVLDYMSEQGGFVVMLDTSVEGTVDAWSRQPLNRADSVTFLNSVLKKLDCAAVCNGRMLTIYNRAQAAKQDLPIQLGGNPSQLPSSDAMVVQVLPVRLGGAAALAQQLAPLLLPPATMTANESGSSLVITASETDVKRMAKIIKAIEDAGSKSASIKVFRLRNGDAKNLASVVNEAFANNGTSSSSSVSSQQSGGGRSSSQSSGGSGPGGGAQNQGGPGGGGPGGDFGPGGDSGPGGGGPGGGPGGFGGPPGGG